MKVGPISESDFRLTISESPRLRIWFAESKIESRCESQIEAPFCPKNFARIDFSHFEILIFFLSLFSGNDPDHSEIKRKKIDAFIQKNTAFP